MIELAWFCPVLEAGGSVWRLEAGSLEPEGTPPPRVICHKSVELIENKGVDRFGDDKEFVTA